MDIPVLLVTFKRPDTTRTVLERLRTIRPSRLFVAADSPRDNVPGEKEQCNEVRNLVDCVDWQCEVQTLFQDKNLGCGLAPKTAMDWFFEHVEEGIILEDDCLPDPSFFPYCAELLERYRHDTRIGVIGGNNFLGGQAQSSYSYYFSRYGHIWGWATWRRYWQLFDFKMSTWPEMKNSGSLYTVFDHNPAAVNYWTQELDSIYQGRTDVWDYQLSYAGWVNNMFGIVPSVNLVTNIGFGSDATHTTHDSSIAGNIPTTTIDLPLRHPPCVVRDAACDAYVDKHIFGFEVGIFSNEAISKKRLKDNRALETEPKQGENLVAGLTIPGLTHGGSSVDAALEYIKQHKVEEAEVELNGLKAQGAQLINYNFAVALCNFLRGEPRAAINLLQEELQAFPENLQAKEWLNYLSSEYEINPNDSQAIVQEINNSIIQIEQLWQANQKDEAMQSLRTIITSVPNLPGLRVLLTHYLIDLENFQEALKALEEEEQLTALSEDMQQLKKRLQELVSTRGVS